MIMDAKFYFRNDQTTWEIFLERILNNSFFFNQEHYILALLTDSRKQKRKLGKKLIMQARRNRIPGVRSFLKIQKHQINLNAQDYSTFLKIDTIEVMTEPPPTMLLTETQLEEIVQGTNSVITLCGLEHVYCHTQGVERAVATTALAAKSVIG